MKTKGTKVPASKRMAPKGKPHMQRKQSPSPTKGTMLSNPYQNTPVKSNPTTQAGFNFPGAIY